MAMTEQERFDCWAEIMRHASKPFPGTILKADLRAAVNAADDWCDANQASFVAALPEPFKSASSALHKRMLLIFVIAARDGKKVN